MAVAADLRDHGPTVLLASCASKEHADVIMGELEMNLASGDRGSGQKKDARYVTAGCCNVFVAGRAGIVKSVTARKDSPIYEQLKYLVAEVRLNVHVCQMMQFSVAVAAPRPCVGLVKREIGETGQALTNGLRDVFIDEEVRLLGGGFRGQLRQHLDQLRTRMTANVAAWIPWRGSLAGAAESELVQYRSSPFYIFALGGVEQMGAAYAGEAAVAASSEIPPNNLEDLGNKSWHALVDEFVPRKPVVTAPALDKSRGWPVSPRVLQKVAKVQAKGTAKLSIYC